MQDWFGFERNHYDRIGHLMQGFGPAIVIRELLIRTSPLAPGKWLFTIIVFTVLGISATYEFTEWWAALAGGDAAGAFLGTQGDVWDTQWDMFLAGCGAIAAQLVLARLHDRQLVASGPGRTRRSATGARIAVCAMPAGRPAGYSRQGGLDGPLDPSGNSRSRTGLAGCAVPGRPPLGPIYRPTRGNVDQPPLVVIPGAFGSSLRDRRTGREIWPGTNPQLLMSNYRGLELDIDPATLEPLAGDVEAYEIFREGLGRDFYGKVVDMLHNAGGYAHGKVGEPPVPAGAATLSTSMTGASTTSRQRADSTSSSSRSVVTTATRGCAWTFSPTRTAACLRGTTHVTARRACRGRAVRAHRSGRLRHSPPAARRDAEPRHHAARAR